MREYITGKHISDGNAMPGFLGSPWEIAGLKWIGTGDGLKYGLPRRFAIIILTDPKTFEPLAIIGGAWITAMRTGGATVVATKYLARKESEIACIVGAGVQGDFSS